MKNTRLILLVGLLVCSVVGQAQELGNNIKLNLTSTLQKNFAVSYERILNKTVSISLGLKYRPSSGIPFSKTLINLDVLDDGDGISDVKLNSLAFTPEVRFYLNKNGYGQGFYLAPFYRYATFNIDNLILDYDATNKTVKSNGKVKSHTGGISVGVQWNLGKRIVLDWNIIGFHYGNATGTLDGKPESPFTSSEQADLQDEAALDGESSIFTFDRTVTSDRILDKITSPWGGIRAGISIGFKF